MSFTKTRSAPSRDDRLKQLEKEVEKLKRKLKRINSSKSGNDMFLRG